MILLDMENKQIKRLGVFFTLQIVGIWVLDIYQQGLWVTLDMDVAYEISGVLYLNRVYVLQSIGSSQMWELISGSYRV
jgi:hypothetical protein